MRARRIMVYGDIPASRMDAFLKSYSSKNRNPIPFIEANVQDLYVPDNESQSLNNIDQFLDRFGADVPVEPIDEHAYALFAPVRVSPPFFGWVFQFGGRVKILAPDDVREQMLLMLEASRAAGRGSPRI